MKPLILYLTMLSLFLVMTLAMTASAAQADESAAVIATFDVLGERFRVRIENPQTIEQVRALERGESTATIPNGKLLRGSDGNEPWSWHLDPQDIEMVEAAFEVCDATPSYIEENLDQWLEEVGRYCPFSAELVSVEEVDVSPPSPTTTPSPSPEPTATPTATATPSLPETGGGPTDDGPGIAVTAMAALLAVGALLVGVRLLAARR